MPPTPPHTPPSRKESRTTHDLRATCPLVNRGTGSVLDPLIVVVNLDQPERNYPFVVKYVPFAVCKRDGTRDTSTVEYECFDIEVCVPVLDTPHWTAFVPTTSNAPPGLEKRIVDIKAPSLSCFQQERNSLKLGDRADVEHQILVNAISDAPCRPFHYWRLVFPQEYMLNNSIFGAGCTLCTTRKKVAIAKDAVIQGIPEQIAVLLHFRIGIVGEGKDFGRSTMAEEELVALFQS